MFWETDKYLLGLGKHHNNTEFYIVKVYMKSTGELIGNMFPGNAVNDVGVCSVETDIFYVRHGNVVDYYYLGHGCVSHDYRAIIEDGDIHKEKSGIPQSADEDDYHNGYFDYCRHLKDHEWCVLSGNVAPNNKNINAYGFLDVMLLTNE